MFVELNLLVQTQGETIDTIEANMAQAEVKVASGNVELGNAKRKQKTARKRKFICIAAISGVLLLAIIIALASIFGWFHPYIDICTNVYKIQLSLLIRFDLDYLFLFFIHRPKYITI